MRTTVANRSGAVRNVWSERFSGRRSGGVRRFFERSHHEDGIAVVGGGTGIGGDFIIRKRAGARRQLWRRAKRRHRGFLPHRRVLRQHGVRGPLLGFSYDTGGYCDSTGCPDDFWDYPIAYCPVYFAGEWYRGPFYYRYWQGNYYYWIRGDWRRDEWRGDRPDDACVGRF